MAPNRKQPKSCKVQIILFAIVVFSAFVSSGGAQTKSVADLATYRGADREEMLKVGAKKEDKLFFF